MITNYLREQFKPIINDCIANDANTISNRYIADMKSIHNDLYDIRMRLSELTDIDYAGDIADNISAYEIASHIEIDATDIEIDYAALARHLGDNIEINASDLDIDYRNLADRIANEIYSNDRIDTLERKMDLLLNLNGIGAEDLLVYSNTMQSEEPNMHDGLDDYQKALLAPYDSREQGQNNG